MNKHILVVDNEPQVRELVSLYLLRQGYRVSGAADSTEAFKIFAREKVDLVILEITLGVEDGLAVLPRIKKEFPDTKVIILTGVGFVEDLMQEAMQKGADSYLSKILPLDELLLAVNRALKPSPLTPQKR